MRPTYETDEYLVREKIVAEAIGAIWSCQVFKLPKKLFVDLACCRDSIVTAWCEIRIREARYGGTLMFAWAKYLALLNAARDSNKPAVIAVHWPDGLFWWAVEKRDWIIRIDHRTDCKRGDAQDIEPVIDIPSDEFKKMGPPLFAKKSPVSQSEPV